MGKTNAIVQVAVFDGDVVVKPGIESMLQGQTRTPDPNHVTHQRKQLAGIVPFYLI